MEPHEREGMSPLAERCACAVSAAGGARRVSLPDGTLRRTFAAETVRGALEGSRP